jgi:lipoyl-dependent peroxiredoxin
MKRFSTVVWHGSGKEGSGTITSQSKVIDHANYAWNTRFKDKKGTNPEELIAAAHASCFTMKLSFLLSDAGHVPENIETTAYVEIGEGDIKQSHLRVNAKISGIDKEVFNELAEKAKTDCPVSRILSLRVTMETSINQESVVSH